MNYGGKFHQNLQNLKSVRITPKGKTSQTKHPKFQENTHESNIVNYGGKYGRNHAKKNGENTKTKPPTGQRLKKRGGT